MKVGVLHPGAMGVSVGLAAAAKDEVLWASAGRRGPTVERATAAGFTDCGSLESLLDQADLVIAVCPPDAACGLAEDVAACGFAKLYVDANAVSPNTAKAIADIIEGGGARFVDGGIIGLPAHKPGTTRLYLSGAGAADVTALFAGSPLEAISLGDRPGDASAMKMCYAAYTKGSAALLLAIRSLAKASSVEDALLAEWQRSIPGLDARSDRSISAAAPKAWRWIGEMAEIARTFEEQNLPGGFHHAAEEIFTAVASFKDTDGAPDPADVIDALRRFRQS